MVGPTYMNIFIYLAKTFSLLLELICKYFPVYPSYEIGFKFLFKTKKLKKYLIELLFFDTLKYMHKIK